MISTKQIIRLGIPFSLVMLFLLAGAGDACAQRTQRQEHRGRDARKEAIEARRISYITTKLSLSTDEAKLFWPLYNEYTQKVDEISADFSKKRETMPDPGEMTAEEAANYVEAELTRFEESAALRREYTEKLLEVISVKQVALLFDAERGFNRMLFREAQRRHRSDDRQD